MRFVIFGLTVSSSWGNGHATLWRGLIAALTSAGHRVTFFERDVAFYAQNRDLYALDAGGTLALYGAWPPASAQAEVDGADVAIVTSYCPDGIAAGALVIQSRAGLRVFYDLDTPVTLQAWLDGEDAVGRFIGPAGLAGFDLVLSYTGGTALEALQTHLHARRVAPLYGWADPAIYRPVPPQARYAADLSYLGTYAADRQAVLERLFVAPAQARPQQRFMIGGAQYPGDFPWTDNIYFVRHLPPAEHPAFYCSARLTLNVTRAAMARMGWCPSGRLFEAAAAGTPILSDGWPGLSAFFEPGREILVGHTTDDVLAAIDLPDTELAAMATRARDRVLGEHTAAHRAAQLVALCDDAMATV